MIYPENAVLLAPLAGHTDLPMRNAVRRSGCRFAFTEMIDAGSLTFGNLKTFKLADRGSAEPFLGIQLVGSDPETLRKAVEIINDRNYDVLDFNLGCPAPKVERKCEGIMFALQRPDEAVAAVELLARYSRIPVTVKTRIQDYHDPEPTIRFLKRLRDAGAQAITLHGRVMKAFYSGPVAFEVIRACREALPEIPLIANGGVMDFQTAAELREKTGCSRIMVARGALGNPWIFREIEDGRTFQPPSVQEFADEIERHFMEMLECYGPELAFRVSRKTLLDYLRGRGYPGTLRATVSFLDSMGKFHLLMQEIRRGPAPGYWTFLEKNPLSPRRIFNITQ